MTTVPGKVINVLKKIVIGVWDFFFLFMGAPYEKQAERLKLDELEPHLSGPENEKTTHVFYRANKVSN